MAGPRHHPDRVQVVGGARHEVAGAMVMEIAEREPLELPEEIVPEVVFDATRGADDDPPHQKAAETADNGDGDQNPRVETEFRAGDVEGEVVDGVLQDPRRQELDGRRQDEKHRAGRKLPPVAAQVRN